MSRLVKTYGCAVAVAASLLLPALFVAPSTACAECKEYNIVEYEDRVEAVCVGEPLTAAQKQLLADEEKRQEQEYKRKKAEEERRQREAEAAESKRKAQAESDRKKQETKPVPTNQRPDANRMNLQKF